MLYHFMFKYNSNLGNNIIYVLREQKTDWTCCRINWIMGSLYISARRHNGVWFVPDQLTFGRRHLRRTFFRETSLCWFCESDHVATFFSTRYAFFVIYLFRVYILVLRWTLFVLITLSVLLDNRRVTIFCATVSFTEECFWPEPWH